MPFEVIQHHNSNNSIHTKAIGMFVGSFVFFSVFLLSGVCRLYSGYIARQARRCTTLSAPSSTLARVTTAVDVLCVEYKSRVSPATTTEEGLPGVNIYSSLHSYSTLSEVRHKAPRQPEGMLLPACRLRKPGEKTQSRLVARN